MKLTRDLAIEIINNVANGDSLRSLLIKYEVNPATFDAMIDSDPILDNKYIRAQMIRSELYVEETVEIADTEPDPNKARVRVDARRWYASKINPKKYGDRIDLNVNQTVDIGKALQEARSRSGHRIPERYQDAIKDAQVIELPIPNTPTNTGLDSVSSTSDKPSTKIDDDDIFS